MVVASPLEYKDNAGTLFEGVLCYDESWKTKDEKRKGVLLIHAFGGCADFEIERAKRLCEEEGYVVLAGDVYGKGVRGKTKEENVALMAPLIDVMGYCFGGLCAIDMARRKLPGVLAAGSFHGTLKPIQGAASLETPVKLQIHHGDADIHIPQEQMRDRKADWHFVSHGKAEHGFTKPDAAELGVPGVSYNEKADHRSWKMMKDFFSEAFH